MMRSTIWWSVCDVYTRLCTVLHASVAEHELYSRSASRMLELAFVRDVTVTAGGEVGSSAARLANDASYRLVERM